MFKKFNSTPLMYWSLELLIIATLIWVCTKINFLFTPIGTFISTIFMPLILATFLYYMLNPVVKLLMKVKLGKFSLNRTAAVVLVVLAAILAIIFAISSVLPNLVTQVSELVGNLPSMLKSIQTEMPKLLQHSWFKNVDLSPYVKQVNTQIAGYAEGFLSGMTNSIGAIVSVLANVTIIILTVPIVLFYMLKDGYKLKPTVAKLIPQRNRESVTKLFNAMSDTLSSYIGGQVIECLFVGTFTIIGYLIIGQPYGMLLGVFAGICNIIPYVGPYFGIFPSLLVAIAKSPQQIIWVILVVIIVQQIDGNFIYPNVIGRSLQIHPLTIIILLLAAGKIAGIFGMILAVPTYAIVKVIVNFLHHIYTLNKESIDDKVKPS